MTYAVVISSHAWRQLEKLPEAIAARLDLLTVLVTDAAHRRHVYDW